jgi:hypothetical protein
MTKLEGLAMTPKQMREAQALLSKRSDARKLIADMTDASIYALEMRLPARDGRIFVFSNDQPGANRELPPATSAKLVEAAAAAVTSEIDRIEARLTEMGVTDFDDDEDGTA